MASRLPVMSGAELVRAFGRHGWTVARQAGSHIMRVKDGHNATLSVPNHAEVARGTLRSLIRASGSTIERFTGNA